MDDSPLGKIITFYSYKGGTGRSMALANAAVWLVKSATTGTPKVLMMDWDLEAPGLHRYFESRTESPEDFERPGVIDYFFNMPDDLPDMSVKFCGRIVSQQVLKLDPTMATTVANRRASVQKQKQEKP